MLSRTKCLSLALVFGIVSQSLGFSKPATASVSSAVSSRPAAISPLNSPLSVSISPLDSPVSTPSNAEESSESLTSTQTISPSDVMSLAAESSVDIEVREPRVWKMDSNLGIVSPFRGNVQYSYPIVVPSMQDNLQPQLAVQYSSAAADQGAEEVTSLGKGWTLDVPRITQGIHLYSDSGCWQYDYMQQKCLLTVPYYRMDAEGSDPHYPDDPYNYKLNWESKQYDLIAKGHAGTTVGEYTTLAYQPLRIWQCSTTSVCNGFPAPGANTNRSGVYWQVWMPDGTLYVFGTDSDYSVSPDGYNSGTSHSERTFHLTQCASPYTGVWQWERMFAQAWYVRHVYAPVRDNPASSSGWSVEYNYDKQQSLVSQGGGWPNGCNIYWYDPEVRLTSIRYGNSLYRTNTGQELYTVGVGYQTVDSVRKPQTISVTAFGTTLYTYTLSYNSNKALSAVRRDERDGVQNTLVSLPGTTYEYSSTLGSALLTGVNNNYGGRTTYTYESDTNTSYHRVATSIVTTGVDNWTQVTTYQYAGPCYNSSEQVCYTGHDWHQQSNALLGYAQVTQTAQTAASGGTTLAVTSLSFATDLRRLGYVLQSRSRDANLAALQAQQTDYQISTNTDPTFASLPDTVWFSAPQTETTYMAGDIGSSPTKQISYKYDGYGSPTIVHDYGLNTTATDDRSTVRQYVSNTTNWIIDKLAREDTYAGYTESFGTPLAGAESFYDGATAITTAPTYGKPTRIDQWLNGQWVTTQRAAYDTFGNPVIITDALGNTTRAAYDPSGSFVLTTTNPLNQVTHYDYYGVNGIAVQDGSGATFGQLRRTTDANSAATTYRYDPHGRLTQVIRPYDGTSAPSTVYTYTDSYNAGGLQGLKVEACQREVSGNAGACQTTLQFYDGLGRLVQSRAEDVGAQVVLNTRYDALGRTSWAQVPVTETTSQNFSRPSGWDSRPGTTTQYDALGRTVAVTGADNAVVRTGYVGLTTIVTDANGHRKDSVSDADGHLQSVVEYSGTSAYTTRYQYDVLGNLRVVTDALTNTTVMTYDSLGRKVGMNDPDMGQWSYSYDLNGNLTTQTDAKGQTVWFGYDALNRMTQKRQDSSSGTVLAQYTYDQGLYSLGRRTAITNPNASTTWTYDQRGRVATELKSFTGVTGTFGSTLQYDAQDRVTQTRLPNGEVVTTTYNAAGQAASLQAGSRTLVSSATYNALGSPQTLIAGNGLQTRYAYFGLDVQAGNNQFYGKVRQICVTTNNCALGYYTGTLMNLAYWYDSVGNVTTWRDDTNQQKENFAYDPLDRLVSATPEYTSVTTLNYTQTYSYNAIGNFISKVGVAQVYSTTQPHAVRSLSDGSSFQYDANGNMTQRTEMSGTQLVTYQQQWDIDNHLVVVTNTTTSQVTQYFYDADGNRVKRISPQGTTVYVNADYEVNGPSQMVMPTVSPTYTHKLYFPIMANAGGVYTPPVNLATARVTYRFNSQQVAVRENSILTFVYGDHLGSASLTTNITGTKISEVRYYPFGEIRYSSGSLPSERTFTGQKAENVGAVGNLMDYGARFFSPMLGRFISADSVVPRVGDPQSFNRYVYVRNSPVTRVDLGGHADTCNSALYSCGNSDPVDPYYTTPSPSMVAGVTHGTPYPYLNAVSFPNGYLGMDVAATKWIRTHPYYNPYTDLNAVTTNWMGEKVQETGFDYINQALIQLLIDHGRTEDAQRLSGAKAALIQASAGVVGTSIIVFGQLLSTGWRPAVVYGMLQENRATPNHASLMQEEVLNLASTGEYSEFHLNQKLSTSTNGKVLSGLQPDILALTVDGRYVVVEVQSTSQSLSSQQAKVNNMVQLISDQGYNASGYVIAQP